MWQNQKFLCIGLGPVSVSACRGSQKQQMFDLKGDGGAFSWVCVDKGGCCCWSGGVVGCTKSRQQNRAKKQLRMSIQYVSNSETDLTVNLSSFIELLVR